MPANPKYLTKSFSQRFAKISAGILGGYFISAGLHVALAFWSNHKIVLVTSIYSIYIIWVVLMIIPFLFRNGWKTWMLYALFIIILAVLIYVGKQLFPIV